MVLCVGVVVVLGVVDHFAVSGNVYVHVVEGVGHVKKKGHFQLESQEKAGRGQREKKERSGWVCCSLHWKKKKKKINKYRDNQKKKKKKITNQSPSESPSSKFKNSILDSHKKTKKKKKKKNQSSDTNKTQTHKQPFPSAPPTFPQRKNPRILSRAKRLFNIIYR